MVDSRQSWLEEVYDLEHLPRARDFLCSADEAATYIGADVTRREVLIVVESADGDTNLALYVDPSVSSERAGTLIVGEGVSHFVMVAFKARFGDMVSEFELELQAEVDNYLAQVFGHTTIGQQWLVGNGIEVAKLLDRSVSARRSVADAGFIDAEHTERGRRYRDCAQLGLRFTGYLESMIRRQALAELHMTLRRFYRLGSQAKIAACLGG